MRFVTDFEKLDSVDIKKFLEANYFFDFDNPLIEKVVNGIKEGCGSKKEIARGLFYFVRDKIPYTMFSSFSNVKDYRASEILNKGNGFCIQKAVLFVAMLRCAGIPSAIAFADIVNHKIPEDAFTFLGTNYFPFHGFAVLKLKNKWLKSTPTFDKRVCKRTGYPVVDFDGESHSILPAFTDSGERFVDYIKFHGVYFEIPLNTILKSWEEVYGKERIVLWMDNS